MKDSADRYRAWGWTGSLATRGLVGTLFVAGLVLGGGSEFAAAAATGKVTLVSHSVAGPTTAAVGGSTDPAVSADGRFVAFESSATDLVAGQSDANGAYDVFLFDRATGAVTLVSHTPAGPATTGDGFSASPAISADGTFVAFESSATDL